MNPTQNLTEELGLLMVTLYAAGGLLIAALLFAFAQRKSSIVLAIIVVVICLLLGIVLQPWLMFSKGVSSYSAQWTAWWGADCGFWFLLLIVAVVRLISVVRSRRTTQA